MGWNIAFVRIIAMKDRKLENKTIEKKPVKP